MPAVESNDGRIRVRAHAKVNLALAVGPARPRGVSFAGYHPIASWMHAIGLHDDVEIGSADRTTYDVAWADGAPVGWDTESDVCVRAHRAMEDAAGRALPVTLRVRKRVPAGGGLGGGSSDAAAVLLGLRDLFALSIPDEGLVSCAHALGTDIPFFVDPVAWRAGRPPRPAVVSGLGDRIDRVGRLSGSLTLFVPPFGCETGAVYRAFDTDPTRSCDVSRVLRIVGEGVGRGAADSGELFNDLAGPAERSEPRLGRTRRALRDALGVPVHVSGSGSTLFCIDPDTGDAPAPIPDGFGVRIVRTRLT